jgi:transglutaminase-like putative cysteine protease
MEYREYGDGFQNAHNSFLSYGGNCWDQTNVFMAMAKYAGLTVRAITGVSISQKLQAS